MPVNRIPPPELLDIGNSEPALLEVVHNLPRVIGGEDHVFKQECRGRIHLPQEDDFDIPRFLLCDAFDKLPALFAGSHKQEVLLLLPKDLAVLQLLQVGERDGIGHQFQVFEYCLVRQSTRFVIVIIVD